MNIIFQTRSDCAEYNADCDCAVVEITPALLAESRRRVEIARKAAVEDSFLYELYFWDGTAEFYDHTLIDACVVAVHAATEGVEAAKTAAANAWLAELEKRGYARLPEGVNLAKHTAQATECDQMIVRATPIAPVRQFQIAWLTSPKHTDLYVMTDELPFAALEAHADGAQANQPEVLP
jgi:hypothetical protein